jgi:hypothetical protein
VSSNDTHVPKHRGVPAEPAIKKGIKKSVLFSGIAVATTGVAVSSGVALKGAQPDAAAAALAGAKVSTSPNATLDRDRSFSASRSDRRTPVDATKASLLSQASGGQVTRTEEIAGGDPKDIARAMLAEFGWSQDQFSCLDPLFTRESNWNPRAANRSSRRLRHPSGPARLQDGHCRG